MKIGTMMITAGVLALGLATWTPSKAQGPMYDRVNVNLPYSVSIGERTLPPGDYVIQQLRDQGGGSKVLLIYSDNGMKFETSAMTIPALEGNNVTQENTRVVLHHFGSDYYFDKVWIQGKDYGYEFPLPDAVKSRQRERLEPISVAANYSTVQSTDAATTATTAKTTTTASAATSSQTTTTAATNKQTTTAQAATTPATTATTSGQTTLGQAAAQSSATTPSTAQNTMQPATTPSTTTSRSTMTPSTTMATNTAAQHGSTAGSADRSMPNTSAGWLMMLLSGGALSGAGMALRRKR